jgi:hypothetical protein
MCGELDSTRSWIRQKENSHLIGRAAGLQHRHRSRFPTGEREYDDDKRNHPRSGYQDQSFRAARNDA